MVDARERNTGTPITGFDKHLQGVAETDDVGGCGDGVGQREHEADGAPELRSKRAGDHVVNAT